MKIEGRRKAISQSMDLFIIIAAVLGVGGIVSASVYNLVSSSSANTSVEIVQVATKAGATSGASPLAISVSVKNDGGSPISCTQATCQVVFAGTNTGSTTPPACLAPCSIVSGGAGVWSIGGPSGPASADGPLTFVTNTFTLMPGAQTSFILDNGLSAVGDSPAFWTSGASVTVEVLFGSSTAQVAVTSQ